MKQQSQRISCTGFQSHRSLLITMLFLLTFLLLGTGQTTHAAGRQNISMYLGEVKVMEVGNVIRVALGNPKVISNSLLHPGQLVILANAVGITSMHLWLEDGSEMEFDVLVKEKQSFDSYLEIKQLLTTIPSVTVKKVGELIVLTGTIRADQQEIFERIVGQFKGVLNLVTHGNPYQEISSLLTAVPNLKVRTVGSNTVLSGEISDEYSKIINLVTGKFPNVINMTRAQAAIAGKMVYMEVKIMEVSKSFSEKLGINWSNLGIVGPSLEFGWQRTRNGASILNASATSSSLKKSDGIEYGAGYIGIATGITSTINLAEDTGDAILLAEPRLSARSGGKAEFLAGGEYPLPVSNDGQVTVEFKKYGIQLMIEPVVDELGNILAHVDTEVSTIDDSVAVQDIPGIKSRSTKTDISMRDNQTLVIAGLLSDEAGKSFDKVKGLGDIPVLGALFRSKSFQNKQTELIIFVTPRVYDATSPINMEAIEKAARISQDYNELVKGGGILD